MLYTSNSFVPYNYELKDAENIFLGIPFSSTSVSETSQYGPTIVRESLKMTESWDNERKKHVFDKVCDLGDIEVVPGSYELTEERIIDTIQEARQENKDGFMIFIGGEHLVSLPIVKALKPKTIIHLDAHSDLRQEYMGLEHSHVTWAYHASKISNIIQLGVRSTSENEDLSLAKQTSIEEFMKEKPELETPIHISIDMDVFDPSYVVTGLPESNGLRPEQVLNFIDFLRKTYNIGSMDIVEIADRNLPSKTGFLASELIKKIIK